jgi:hypothetical protein
LVGTNGTGVHGNDEPHPEELPLGRVSKDGHDLPWFETREDALLTMRGVFAAIRELKDITRQC